jgi:anti-sigma-K factor RskA
MTRKETITILTLLSQTYENFEKRMDTDEKVESMIMLWTECLGDLDYNLVLQAVKKTIIESPYPPTIHEIRKNATEMVKPNTSKTAIEAWNEAYSMICNGLYMTEEQFEMASPEVKKFFGNVRQVKELAQTDSDTINTVTKGQFLKQYEIIIEREKQDKLLPEKMQNLIKGLTSKIEIKQIGE